MRVLLAALLALAPTPAERVSLVTAVHKLQGDVSIQSVAVAKSDRHYGSVRWGYKVAQSDSLFRLRNGRWLLVWSRLSDRPADGACAYVPASVVRDLYRVTCPPDAALHARPATSSELALLEASFRSSKLTRYWRDALGLSNPCISRIDPDWAAVIAKFPDTKGVVWFRRAGSWKVAHETLFGQGAVPSPRIVLSLAACVGYNAAEYNG